MKPYAELLEFNQPNPIRMPGHTRIRDQFLGLNQPVANIRDAGDGYVSLHHQGGIYHDPERIIEFAGSWDYGEGNALKLGQRPGENIIRRWIDMGHHSMIEVAYATFFIECSRVVSHEIVRHRIASYQQESQRFVKYDGLDNSLDVFYLPDEVQSEPEVRMAVLQALATYKELRAKGVAPQLARYVLPNAMRTRMVMSTNVREWRHIISLRLDKAAQPEMRELMQQIYDQLVMVFPNAMHGVGEGERSVR